MLSPTEKHLIKNGIIRTTSELCYCALCERDTDLKNTPEHIENPSHVKHLQWYRLIFKLCGDEVKCDICKTFVAWDRLKSHGKSHTLVPWWEPEDNYDKYEIFFKNRIVQWQNLFRCCLCNTDFPNWEVALVHVTDSQHQGHECVNEKSPLADDFLVKTSSTWEIIVSEGLVAFNATELQCTICNWKNVALINIQRHIKGLAHLCFKSKYCFKFDDHRGSDAVVTIDTESLVLERHNCEHFEAIGPEEVFKLTNAGKAMGFTNEVEVENVAEGFEAMGSNREFEVTNVAEGFEAMGSNREFKVTNAAQEGKSEGSPREIETKNFAEEDKAVGCKIGFKVKVAQQSGAKCSEREHEIKNFAEEDNAAGLEKNFEVKIAQQGGANCFTRLCKIQNFAEEDEAVGLGKDFKVKIDQQGGAKGFTRQLQIQNFAEEDEAAGFGKDFKVKVAQQSGANGSTRELKVNVGQQSGAKGSTRLLEIQNFAEEDKAAGLGKDFKVKIAQQSGAKGSTRLLKIQNFAEEDKAACLVKDFYVKPVQQSGAECSARELGTKNIAKEVESVVRKEELKNVPEFCASELNYILKQSNSVSYCLICGCQFAANATRNHTMDPNHVLALKRNGCDGISPLKGADYHCKYCDLSICSIGNVYQHVTGKKHLKNLKYTDDWQVEAIENVSTVSKPIDLSERLDPSDVLALKRIGCAGISPLKGADYHCKYCDLSICSIGNVYQHIKGKKHLKNVQYADDWQVEAIENVRTIGKPIDLSELPPRQHRHCDYIVRLNQNDAQCKVCDCIISTKGTSQLVHVTGKLHERSLKKYGCERITFRGDNIYHCECCDFVIYHLENVYAHLKEAKHLDSLTVAGKQPSKTPNIDGRAKDAESLAAANKPIKLPELPPPRYWHCDCVVQLNRMEAECIVCDCIIPAGDTSQENHVLGKLHERSLKKYGCERITFRGDNIYHCECCDVVVYDLENVYAHLKEARHLDSLTVAEKQPSKTPNIDGRAKDAESLAAAKKTIELPELPPPRYWHCDYVVQLNRMKAQCKVCDCIIPAGDTSQENHLSGKLHERSLKKYGCERITFRGDNIYHCECCDVVIYHLEDVYAHLKEARHIDSLSVAEKQPSKTPNIDGSAKDAESLAAANKPIDLSELRPLPYWHCDYVVQLNRMNAQCIVCDCIIPAGDTSQENHVSEKLHEKSLKKYGCERITFRGYNIYHCECCNVFIYHLENVYAHLKEARHLDSLTVSEKQPPKTPNIDGSAKDAESLAAANKPIEISELPPRQHWPCDFVVQLNATDAHCIVCDCSVPARGENREIHVMGKQHEKSMTKFGCRRISFRGDVIYYCECCCVVICHLENVYAHLKEASHINSVTVADKRLSKNPPNIADKGEASNLEIPSVLTGISSPRFSRNYATQKTGSLADGRSQIERYIAGNEHSNTFEKYGCDDPSLRSDRSYCECCEIEILDSEHVCNVKEEDHSQRSSAVDGQSQLDVIYRRLNDLKKAEPGPELTPVIHSLTADISRLVEQLKRNEVEGM